MKIGPLFALLLLFAACPSKEKVYVEVPAPQAKLPAPESTDIMKSITNGDLHSYFQLSQDTSLNPNDFSKKLPFTYFHLAIMSNQPAIFNYMLNHQNANVDSVEKNHGRTAVMLALEYDIHPQDIIFLAEKIKKWNIQDYHQRNYIHYAVNYGQVNFLELLLEKNGALEKSKFHVTPLMGALSLSDIPIVRHRIIRILLEYSQHKLDTNLLGQSVFHLAILYNLDLAGFRLLFRHFNEEQLKAFFSMQDKSKHTPRDLAKIYQREDVIELFEK